MKHRLPLAVVIGCAVLIGSCSSFAYLHSDDYAKAGIRVTTDPALVSDMKAVNRWATELGPTYSAQDVGVWAANRLAKQGRHDVLILVELISYGGGLVEDSRIPPVRGLIEDNMWRISVYPIQPKDNSK